MKTFVICCVLTTFTAGASALAVDRSGVERGRTEARHLSAIERSGLRLRILVAQGLLLELRKNKWILDKVGTPGRSTLVNFGLGVGSATLDSYLLTSAMNFLSNESRVSFHRDVRDAYRAIDHAQTELTELYRRYYGTGELGLSPERSPELTAEMAATEGSIADLMARKAVVDVRPWQRPARYARMTLVYGLGVVLVVDMLGSYMQIALDPNDGERLADQLNAFVWEAKELLNRAEAD